MLHLYKGLGEGLSLVAHSASTGQAGTPVCICCRITDRGPFRLKLPLRLIRPSCPLQRLSARREILK